MWHVYWYAISKCHAHYRHTVWGLSVTCIHQYTWCDMSCRYTCHVTCHNMYTDRLCHVMSHVTSCIPIGYITHVMSHVTTCILIGCDMSCQYTCHVTCQIMYTDRLSVYVSHQLISIYVYTYIHAHYRHTSMSHVYWYAMGWLSLVRSIKL